MKPLSLCLSMLALLLLATFAFAEPPLPAKLQNLPRYPGATVMQTMDVSGNTNAIFEVEATPAEVAEFFISQLSSQGWSKVMEARQDDGAMISFAKGSTSLTVGVGAGEGGKVSYTIILTGE